VCGVWGLQLEVCVLWINLAEDRGLWRTAVKSLRNVLVQQMPFF